MRVRLVVDLEIDREEFTVPSDGDIKGELKNQVEEFLNDINGVEVTAVRSI